MEGGPPGFRQDFTCPVLLRKSLERFQAFVYRAITFFGCTFQYIQLAIRLLFSELLQPLLASKKVWAISRSLAATEEISFDFCSCRYLDVSVPCVRFFKLCIHLKISWLNTMMGFPIRKSPGQRLLASLRGLSQLTTSFVAS